MRLLLLLFFFLIVTAFARPLEDFKDRLELLLEEEILLDRVQQEIENAIVREEKKIKRQLQGEESMMNFLNDYRKRLSFGPVAGSQFRPGR